MAAVDLTCVDGGALVHGAVLDEGVGADDTARADDRLAPQDGARKDHSTRSNDCLLYTSITMVKEDGRWKASAITLNL